MYIGSDRRYEEATFVRCGRSGLVLPAISLGLWHNFGATTSLETGRAMLRRAFDLGITHFDLANNYGPPYGAAEETFGLLYRQDFRPYRKELVLSTKAGYDMWPGPYGNWGSRKYLLSSLDESLQRMGLEYVDIFYSHRPDPNTPVEETVAALAHAVRAGKALYVGISNYNAEQTARAAAVLCELKTPCLIHQMRYSLFQRAPEEGLFGTLEQQGIGGIAFSPLAQGMLSERYLDGIPSDSRAAVGRFLKPADLNERRLEQIRALKEIARERSQSLAQMALVWVTRQRCIASVLIGASRLEQIEENVRALDNRHFTAEELQLIDAILQ
ncbi:L-glyceraldehyde 3-phosphate reductase [Silvibacterium bohemicum]|uniref:L-glyceraldehyde 3-phosphate reductase n=1 Tax=Silvibacterium bohemicum TaxID=1577686 RepID=A0A841JPW2_9BACT|nr:L-glyceraldehyde 3-phosphate reductase [Silvibacterium bohemicum]MBB6143180.1 L-glyceraldehyde 3-phosphate reductase [Silvibacterium bohemicum]